MMKGFKDSTKMQMGHTFKGGQEPCPDYASGSRTVFAVGGLVPPMGGGAFGGPRVAAPRPILPRPRVMPNMKMQLPHAKLAKGGKVGDGGGGPYNPSGGNSLEMANRPYSKVEQDHPRKDARPGYAKGGKKPFGKIKKGALHKDMHIPQGQKIPVSAIRSKLARGKASGNKKGVKRDVFAINAKTKFADGGSVDCDTDAMQGIASQAVARHIKTPPPQGHGVKPRGNLAFMSKPLVGK